jgi:hypothetical protein
MSNEPCVHVLVVGDACSGKTSFLARHQTGEFLDHEPSTVTRQTIFSMFTNFGLVRIMCWDGPGTRDFVLQFSHAVHVAFLFYDVDDLAALLKWKACVRFRFGHELPLVVVRSKTDLRPEDGAFTLKLMDLMVYGDGRRAKCELAMSAGCICLLRLKAFVNKDVRRLVMQYVWASRHDVCWGNDSVDGAGPIRHAAVSIVSLESFEKPLEDGLQISLAGLPTDTVLCSAPNMVLPHIEVTPELIEQWSREIELASTVAIPWDDDDDL